MVPVMLGWILHFHPREPASSGVKFSVAVLPASTDSSTPRASTVNVWVAVSPDDAKPFEELVKQLDALGLGNLGGLPGAGGSAQNEGNIEEYSKCIQDAQGDNAKIRKCADLLTTP